MTDSTESPLRACVPFTSSCRSPTQRSSAANGERNESSEASLAATVKTITKTPAPVSGESVRFSVRLGEKAYMFRVIGTVARLLRAHLKKAFQGCGKAFRPARRRTETESRFEEKIRLNGGSITQRGERSRALKERSARALYVHACSPTSTLVISGNEQTKRPTFVLVKVHAKVNVSLKIQCVIFTWNQCKFHSSPTKTSSTHPTDKPLCTSQGNKSTRMEDTSSRHEFFLLKTAARCCKFSTQQRNPTKQNCSY